MGRAQYIMGNLVLDANGHVATGWVTTVAGAVVLVTGTAQTAGATYSTKGADVV